MTYISIDLGTTNIKAALFNEGLELISFHSEQVQYEQAGNTVEFSPTTYFETVILTIKKCIRQSDISPSSVRSIILTGQAESLIMIDEKGIPVYNGISWMDERSGKECAELKNAFSEEKMYSVTGQPSLIPTWPITKMLWLKKNKPEKFKKVSKFLLLKDYIQFRLTGKFAGEFSIYNFSHYLDITEKRPWEEFLNYCGVQLSQLPELVEPCTDIGPLSAESAESVGLTTETTVNVGTLDHFAGMIGTGNIQPGVISETTGTVLAIATMLEKPVFSKDRIPVHYGPFQDIYVMLSVCESGGVSLEWFKNTFAGDLSFDDINRELALKKIPNELIFLPYVAGVNAPDYNLDASGVFFGFKMHHDTYDFAYAVMEGLVHLLKRNLESFKRSGIDAEALISTGGGARSRFWSQLKADITGYRVAIPANEEAACLGAAMIGAVSGGSFSSYEEAVSACVSIKEEFTPLYSEKLQKKYDLFGKVYNSLLPVFSAARGK